MYRHTRRIELGEVVVTWDLASVEKWDFSMGNAASEANSGAELSGKPYVDFCLESLDEDLDTSLGALLNGLPTLLVFVTSWCPDCSEAAARCDELNSTYSGRLNVLLVSVDATYDAALALVRAVPAGGCGTGGVDRAQRFWAKGGTTPTEYGVTYVPHRVLLSKSGIVMKNYDMEWSDVPSLI